MRCLRCRAEIRDDSKFCGDCGAPLGSGAGAGPEAASLTKTLETPVRVLRPGVLIAGKYRILEEIGRGGMGVVYKAEDLKLKRLVALKFLPPHLLDSPEIKERFLIEAQAAAALNHPNICVIHEVGESEERPYIAMEYVEGETLRERLKKGPLKAGEALDIAAQVAAGLGEAHQKGIIHRDIKSANIMVTPKGRAKVMDFGLAKLRGGSSLTRTRTTIGTVAYMSPEQARGGELDGRTDIWSLGVVLFEILTGRLPFRGDHDQTMIRSILHDEPETLRKACPGVKPELERVAGQALVKNPARRYQTMEDFLGDLKAVAEGLMPLKARRRIRKNIFGLSPAVYFPSAAAALVLVLLGFNVLGLRDRIFGGPGRAEPAIRLAVLPFENLTGDPDQDYLSDGLTQEMITLLGGLHPQSLSVIARTSVMRYKKADTPIDRIGRELGVEYVLEGSARREGSRIRITVDLIQVRDQTQLWADVFEREMSSILALQNDVAQKVVKALALKLLPAEQARLAKARPINPEAHEAYLRGLFHTNRLAPGDLDVAEKHFELAIEKDPASALAYAGRSFLWWLRSMFGYASREEALPKAKAAALKAIELDEYLSDAHEVLAEIRMSEWDWDGARESIQKAIELNPNASGPQVDYGWYLLLMGHLKEAQIHFEKALTLDPFDANVRVWHASCLYFQRRYDEAIAAAREAQSFQEDNLGAFAILRGAYHMKGMEKEAVKACIDQFSIGTNDDPRTRSAFDKCYGQRRYAEGMRCAAEAFVAVFPEANILPSDIALLYAMAGEKEKVIEWLETGFKALDAAMATLCVDPIFVDLLRQDPRFQDLLRRMNLPAGDRILDRAP